MEHNRNRYDVIDLLRGVAILLVVIRHVQLRIPFEKVSFIAYFPEQILSAIFMSGNEGVRIFFVISGFLITMNCLSRYSNLNSINIKEFYVYRFARIVPCLIALLIILSVLDYLSVKDYIINSKFSYFEVLFSALTFHLNWLEGVKGYLPPSWDVLWSLSVEEIFYLAFPLVCFFSKRKEVIYCVLIALILIGPLNRYLLEGNKIWQTKAYLSCMDSIAIGCLFALLNHKKNLSKFAVKCGTLFGSLLLIVILMIKRDQSFAFLNEYYVFKTILSVGVGLLLISAVRQQFLPVIRTLLLPIITFGKLSYEIYLTHVFVVIAGVRIYKYYDIDLNDSLMLLIAVIVISGLLGFVVERYYSKPINLWIRNRLN